MTGEKIPITIVVPVKNEALNLAGCLAALPRFTDVVVVDSSSTDGTAEIAKLHGATVINFKWNGGFPKKRNWVLINYKFKTKWVIFIDADEIVSNRFCDEVAEKIVSEDKVGYWINYSNFFLRKALKHGIPQKKLAMFVVGKGLYERIDEDLWSSLDMEVHEHPVIDGSIGEIRSTVVHNDFQGIDKFIERHRNYANWEARRYLTLKVAGGMKSNKFTLRQKLKYRALGCWWYAFAYFIYAYVIRLGFMDLGPGFAYSFYKSWYFFTIYFLIKELRERGWR